MNSAAPDLAVPAWIMKLEIKVGESTSISAWLVRVMLSGLSYQGFLNAEILPPTESDKKQWTLLCRFESVDKIAAWSGSESLSSLISELKPRLDKGDLNLQQHVAEQYAPETNVATAIVTHVKPGKEDEYLSWVSKIHTAQANSVGYRGTFLQPPPANSKAPWTTLLRFDSTESLDLWFDSEERKQILSEAQDLLRYDVTRLTSSFPGWFPTDPATGQSAPRYKTGMLVLTILYPLIILQVQFIRPLLSNSGLGPALVGFSSNVMSVSVISLLMMPIATKVFRFWLFPSGHDPRLESIKGYALIFAIYAVEVGIASLLTSNQQ